MDAQTPFLDVEQLIEQSQPRPRTGWFLYALGLFMLVALTSAYVTSRSPGLARAVDALSMLAMLGLMAGLALMTSLTVRRQREELRRVEALEELVQLRRWPEAAGMARIVLSEPARTPQARIQALIFLSSILARYHQFQDAIALHDYLLENVMFDDMTAHGIRLGRAMAMLREDHLVDADRAISELRRTPHAKDSSGLALVELYRDVKTGHYVEAIERFENALPILRQQLGHRSGDAQALVARAYHMLGRSDEARRAYENATLLTNEAELKRRYPEVVGLSEKYQAARAPMEAA